MDLYSTDQAKIVLIIFRTIIKIAFCCFETVNVQWVCDVTKFCDVNIQRLSPPSALSDQSNHLSLSSGQSHQTTTTAVQHVTNGDLGKAKLANNNIKHGNTERKEEIQKGSMINVNLRYISSKICM